VIIPVIIIPILLSSSSAIIIIIINHLVTTYHQNETKSIGPGTTVYRLWNPQSNLFCSLTTSYDAATIQFPFFCALFICIISSINDPPLRPLSPPLLVSVLVIQQQSSMFPLFVSLAVRLLQ
jgi:hypothetical protein